MVNNTESHSETSAPISEDEFWESLGEKPYGCSRQQVAFVKALLEGMNGKAAAVKAGYSAANAGVQACRTKNNPKVRALLNAALKVKDTAEGELVMPDELLALLSREARRGQTAAGRLRAQEILAKYHSLFDSTPEKPTSDKDLVDQIRQQFGKEAAKKAKRELGRE